MIDDARGRKAFGRRIKGATLVLFDAAARGTSLRSAGALNDNVAGIYSPVEEPGLHFSQQTPVLKLTLISFDLFEISGVRGADVRGARRPSSLLCLHRRGFYANMEADQHNGPSCRRKT